jgi:Polyketide cyclase / dehydrase and lipid transport
MLTAIVFIAIIILCLLIMAYARPNEFSVVRSIDMRASPEKIYAHISDFKNWAAWSPWEKMDPNMKRTYSGAASGKGAKYGWVGNKKVGEGNMEITRAVPSSNMMLDLHFLKPFKADNVTEFNLQPKGAVTNLRWEMRGNTPFMIKVMHMFFNMDKLVGKDFDAGLASLKAIVEK